MQIFIVTREYSDYEGSSTTMLKAFISRAMAMEMSSTLESARELYSSGKKAVPGPPAFTRKNGAIDYVNVAYVKNITTWREQSALVMQSNEDLKEKIISELIGDELNTLETRGWLESDPNYESIEITEIDLATMA